LARAQARFVCQECGAVHPKWAGRCDGCGGWNSLVEEVMRAVAPKGLGGGKGRKLVFSGFEGNAPATPRRVSGIAEFDRVSGGGIVPGSALLVGGDPGIGKSTVLLQVVAALAAGKGGARLRCAYISGEESLDQVRLRAARLGLSGAPVELAAATSIRDIVASLDVADAPDIVVIDSIQTMYLDSLDSAPGTVSQVRAAAQELIRLAKERGFSVILVGHVTKEGLIAGPRVLEHMVDTVLYFEGERGHQFRILRAVKNRFGPTDEIGVFEMTDAGLVEVPNPSALFLAERHGETSGAAVFAGVEGTRPLLVEIQALVAPSTLGTPRRAVVGWDGARLAMVLAVIEARCGVQIGLNDIYLNVAGGLRITEPAADLAVASALLSALALQPVPPETVVFGEIGLSGEVRPVGQADARLKEAGKLGFSAAIVPPYRGRGKERTPPAGVSLREIRHLRQLVDLFGDQPRRAERSLTMSGARR
jgi:DNA repair protein RadA/Sms